MAESSIVVLIMELLQIVLCVQLLKYLFNIVFSWCSKQIIILFLYQSHIARTIRTKKI